jgi:signal transduction histidine kinase
MTCVRTIAGADELGGTASERLERARVLHDGAMQRLCSVRIALGTRAPLASTELRRCRSEVAAAITELRAFIADELDASHATAPATIGASVRDACAEWPDLPITARCERDAELPAALARLVRDFVAEALRNACKHAAPSAVCVRVAAIDTGARIEVVNDGVAPRAPRGSELGLRLLAADARRWGARVDAGPAGGADWCAALTVSLAPAPCDDRDPDDTRRRRCG